MVPRFMIIKITYSISLALGHWEALGSKSETLKRLVPSFIEHYIWLRSLWIEIQNWRFCFGSYLIPDWLPVGEVDLDLPLQGRRDDLPELGILRGERLEVGASAVRVPRVQERVQGHVSQGENVHYTSFAHSAANFYVYIFAGSRGDWVKKLVNFVQVSDITYFQHTINNWNISNKKRILSITTKINEFAELLLLR